MVLRQNSCNLYHNGGYDSLTGDNKLTTTNNAMGNITSKTNLEMIISSGTFIGDIYGNFYKLYPYVHLRFLEKGSSDYVKDIDPTLTVAEVVGEIKATTISFSGERTTSAIVEDFEKLGLNTWICYYDENNCLSDYVLARATDTSIAEFNEERESCGSPEFCVQMPAKKATKKATSKSAKKTSKKKPANYDDVGGFVDRLMPVCKDDLWGYIDVTGEVVIPIQFDDADNFRNGYAVVESNDKDGAIDVNGNVVIPCIYDKLNPFNKSGYAVAQKDGLYGVISLGGKIAVSHEYEDMSISPDENGFLPAKKNGLWGVVDVNTGKEAVPFVYKFIKGCGEGLVSVRNSENRWGFVDTKGELKVPCKYSDAEDFSYGVAKVKADNKFGYINHEGKEITPIVYAMWGDLMISTFSAGLCYVKRYGKYGFIDNEGKDAIAFVYEDAKDFTDAGLAPVKKDGKWGYINASGDQVIPFNYDWADNHFYEDLAIVKIDGKAGFVDKNGNQVIAPLYDKLGKFSNGLAWFEADGKYGYIDKTGTVIIPAEYIDASDFTTDGAAKVQIAKKKGAYIDTAGNIICTYKL